MVQERTAHRRLLRRRLTLALVRQVRDSQECKLVILVLDSMGNGG